MTHKHEWRIRGAGIRCKDFPKCPAKLSNAETENRLNATEELNVEDANVLNDLMPTSSIPAYLHPPWQKAVDALRAYTEKRGEG